MDWQVYKYNIAVHLLLQLVVGEVSIIAGSSWGSIWKRASLQYLGPRELVSSIWESCSDSLTINSQTPPGLLCFPQPTFPPHHHPHHSVKPLKVIIIIIKRSYHHPRPVALFHRLSRIVLKLLRQPCDKGRALSFFLKLFFIRPFVSEDSLNPLLSAG